MFVFELKNNSQNGSIEINMSVDTTFENATLKISRIDVKKGLDSEILLATYPIAQSQYTNITYNDYITRCGVDYRYIFYLYSSDHTSEEYYYGTIKCMFDDIFIIDGFNPATSIKLVGDIRLNDTQRSNKTSIIETQDAKYPYVISSGNAKYDSGSLSGLIVSNDYLENFLTNEDIDKFAEIDFQDAVVEILSNQQPKLLKDWNGRIWIVKITDSPSTSYLPEGGFTLANSGFSWVEVGDFNSIDDLVANGLVGGQNA